MEFKKATRNTNFDDFINGAKETEITKTNKEQEKEQEKIILKLPKDLCEEIDKHNLCEEIDKKLN